MGTTRHRRSRGTRVFLNHVQKYQLTNGFILPGDENFAFQSVSEEKAAWKAHKDKILAEVIAENPGQRPFAWWLFELGDRMENIVPKKPGTRRANPTAEDVFEFLRQNGHLVPGESGPTKLEPENPEASN